MHSLLPWRCRGGGGGGNRSSLVFCQCHHSVHHGSGSIQREKAAAAAVAACKARQTLLFFRAIKFWNITRLLLDVSVWGSLQNYSCLLRLGRSCCCCCCTVVSTKKETNSGSSCPFRAPFQKSVLCSGCVCLPWHRPFEKLKDTHTLTWFAYCCCYFCCFTAEVTKLSDVASTAMAAIHLGQHHATLSLTTFLVTHLPLVCIFCFSQNF